MKPRPIPPPRRPGRGGRLPKLKVPPLAPATPLPPQPREQPIPLDPAPLVAKALSNFEREVGGREAMVRILAHQVDESVEAELVVNLLGDPQNSRESLARLCARAGLTVGRFLHLFAHSRGVAAQLATMNKVWPALPGVAEDVMKRAVPIFKECFDCSGSGTAPHKENEPARPCPFCKGKGQIEIEPDLERQKLALQIGGVLKPAAQQTIIDNSRHETTQNVSMRAFISATNRLLFGAAPQHSPALPEAPVEAELVPPQEGAD